MDVFPKFIIEEINNKECFLVIAECTFHEDIATNRSKVKGGGWYRINDNEIDFYGESTDFGPAKIEDIKRAINTNNVYLYPNLDLSIASDYIFLYKKKIILQET